MSVGPAVHRTSAEANGPPIGDEEKDRKKFNSAILGSEDLLDALNRAFCAFAEKRGVTFSDARLCCMNSENLNGANVNTFLGISRGER